MVAPHPISQLFSIITIPICGYLKFWFLIGKIQIHVCYYDPSKILTLSLIIVFLIIVFDPIEQLFPMLTFFSIIELWPIIQFNPKDTLFPTKTFLPNLTLSLNFVSDIEIAVSSKLSLRDQDKT